MNASIVNFHEVKAFKQAKHNEYVLNNSRKNTLDFAKELNNITTEYNVDPVHQATLLMAKAVDVLTQAGPVPSSIETQHHRAENLLQSVFRARHELLEKNVRIISAETVSKPFWNVDGATV